MATKEENIVNFVSSLLSNLVSDTVVNPAAKGVGSILSKWLKEKATKKALAEAAQNAESDFRQLAREKFGNDTLSQVVASFPLHDGELFQSALKDLPLHFNETFLVDHLRADLLKNWTGDISKEEVRDGIALYIDCLRVRLLRVDGFSKIVEKLAILRIDQRTEESLKLEKQNYEMLLGLSTRKETVATALFTIPAPVADFTGRTKEIETLKSSFKNGALITGVTGGGGIGKTELARKLAEEIADEYPDARMSIDLLGTSETPLSDEPAQLRGLYQQTFSSQKALLLLDNAANENQVRPLIPPKPSAAIITSRKYFSLTEFGLNPVRLDVLSPEDARNLLRKASQKLKENPDTDVDSLATLCGHLPLALRVVASLLNDRPDWTLATLQKRLEDERTRLKRLKRDGDLDLDVEATLSLSYEVLDENTKLNFRKLGVFKGSFIRVSAQAVLGLENETELDDFIGKMITLSLLNTYISEYIDERTGDATIFYELHDLTQLFALTHLFEEVTAANETIQRHAVHYLQWLDQLDRLYQEGGDNKFVALFNFSIVWTNLYAAYNRMSDKSRKFIPSDMPDQWLSTFPFWGAYLLDLYLTPAQKLPILENAVNASQRISNLQLESKHLNNLGGTLLLLGDMNQALNILNKAIEINEGLGDLDELCKNLANLGKTYNRLGNIKEAINSHSRALDLVRKGEDKNTEASILGGLGEAHLLNYDFNKALDCLKQSLEINTQQGNLHGIAQSLGGLGSVHFSKGEYQRAKEYTESALKVSREGFDRLAESACLGALGDIYKVNGEFDKAIELYNQSLSIAIELNVMFNQASALNKIGSAYYSVRNAEKALEYFNRALELHKKIGNIPREGDCLVNIGMVYAAIGEKQKAKTYWDQALNILKNIESPEVKTVESWIANLDSSEQEQIMSVDDFIRMVFEVKRTKHMQGEQLFNDLSKMMIDSNQPPENQSLAKVLRDVMAGIKNPDLSKLTEEHAKVVQEELEKKE